MTENNNQTMSLEDITRALGELAKHVEAIRGGENAPELDPSDPRTIRNFLKALMRKPSADSWYTVRSLDSRKYYRISLVSEEAHDLTKPDGSVLRQTLTHDFTLPVPPEELTAGWVIRAEGKVLDVFEMDDKKYAIYEMLS